MTGNQFDRRAGSRGSRLAMLLADETVPGSEDTVFAGCDAVDNEVTARVGGGAGKRAGIPQGIQYRGPVVEIPYRLQIHCRATDRYARPDACDNPLNSGARLRGVLSDLEWSRNLGRNAERLSEEKCPEKDPDR